MHYRCATESDSEVLARMNRQLIRDEGHRNKMTLPELGKRMANWLKGEYQAVLFEENRAIVGYALFKHEPEHIYLRQLYVEARHRRKGVGKDAVQWLSANPWKNSKRLRLDVLAGNKSGMAFLKAVGFAEYCLTLEKENSKFGSEICFRQLANDEADAGHAIIMDAFEWLKAKEIRQWLVEFPRSAYSKRQEQGSNFGLFCDGELAVILSLIDSRPECWISHLPNKNVWWLCTMATARQFHGRRLGEQAVLQAGTFLQNKNVDCLYLDCVNGEFLPNFYKKNWIRRSRPQRYYLSIGKWF
jgi:GNAT superfamily N-acetyltransferase